MLIPALLNRCRVTIVDLSLGGAGIEIPRLGARPPGRRRATLHLPGRDKPIAVMIIHQRATTDGYRVGTRFVRLTEDQFEHIQSLMANPRRHSWIRPAQERSAL